MTRALVYPYGNAVACGCLKTFAEDFVVHEQLGFEPSGEGEHLFIHVEKKNLTTPQLIEQVARDYGVKPNQIGYSGLKDKVAVTRQWLSLPLPFKSEIPDPAVTSDYVVLNHVRHDRKLRTGTHRFNDFKVVLRDVKQFGTETLGQIALVKKLGMANYFGQQRFGVNTDNVQQALQVFSNTRKTKRLTRKKKSLYLSALRSEIFNQILSRRIEADIWQQPIPGDVFMLDGSHSIFNAEIDDGILDRYRRFDISSTASLYGTGISKINQQAGDIEKVVFNDNPKICECLTAQGVKLQMRPVRVEVKDFSFDYCAEQKQLLLTARLPSGSYFTSFVNHFIKTDL